MRPADLPPAERWPHGVRARYTSGCRCDPCRAANTAYQATRARAKVYGRTNRLVPIAPVLRHLRALRRAGLGRRTIAEASKVAESVIGRILDGTKPHVRETTAKRLLAVTRDAIADAALVPAAGTWQKLHALFEEGYTREDIARRLGSKGKRAHLQIGTERVQAATAARVERLHRALTT